MTIVEVEAGLLLGSTLRIPTLGRPKIRQPAEFVRVANGLCRFPRTKPVGRLCWVSDYLPMEARS